jgi:hypothetical protein
MNIYRLMLFVHVTSDIGIFVGIGAWLLGLAALRHAQDVSQVRALAALIHGTEPLSVVSSLLTIASGLYMLLTVWGWRTGWALVALGSIIVGLPPLLHGVIEPKMRSIHDLALETPDGPIPARLQVLIHDTMLGMALRTMVGLVIGIVFLMTNKPALGSALAVMLIAVGLGAASGLPLARARHGGPDQPRSTASGE